MKTAIIHDQLSEFGGAERVLIALKKIFPQADVFTSVYKPESLGVHSKIFKEWKINESWFGRIPFLRNYYSPFRFATAWIWESFDLSKYDLVISSSGSWMSKGVITKPQTLHVCYIHHPPRYLYYYPTAVSWQKYLPVRIYGHLINHFLRVFDYLSAQRPDILIANSFETKKRIKKFYKRDSEVIYPPVNIPDKLESQYISGKRQEFYLTVSRLARAKNIDLLIKAFNKLGKKLVVVGEGKDREYLESIADKNIVFKGNITDKNLKELYLRAKAFVFASKDEEFGIAPVEALGYAVPVIAFASGGVKEYIKSYENGLLYQKLEVGALASAIMSFEGLSERKTLQMRKNARRTAKNFTFSQFKRKILSFIKSRGKEDLEL